MKYQWIINQIILYDIFSELTTVYYIGKYDKYINNDTYTNIINISPQNNLYGQKQNLSGIKIQNINNNIYNRYFQYNPFLNRNYSISFGNNNNFNLNQFYRQNSSLLNTSNFNTNAISNNTHIHSNTIVNTSSLNNSIIYDNNSNSLYSMIFKRNN